NLADVCILAYMAESALLRVEKLVSLHGEEASKVQIDMVRVYLNDALDKANIAGKNAVNAMAEGDMQRMMLMGVKRFTKTTPFNTKEARRRVAATLIDANQYNF